MKKRKTITAFLIILLILPLEAFHICSPLTVQAAKNSKNTAAAWPKCPSIDAEACCVMDLSSGLVLYSKNMKKKNYPASITKIMTTLLTIENCSLGEEVPFSAEAVNSIPWDGTKLGVLAGETLSIDQCLYAIMLQSANDVCAGVAEYISGSQEKFSKLMTKRAKEIGCVHTHFTNPHGLHDENHYTCAYDMCLIGRETMKNSIFRKVTSSKSYTVAATNMSTERPINNHHQMINGYRSNYIYEYDNCIGGKTGYTSAAENTLVTFAKKDNMELVCVVMRAQGTSAKENQYTDTKKLLESAFENYHLFAMDGSSTEDSKSDVSDRSPMFNKYSCLLSETSPMITLQEQSYMILPKKVKKREAKQKISYLSNITLSDTSDTVIGNVTYTYDGKEVGQSEILYHPSTVIPLTTSSDINFVISFQDKLTNGLIGKILENKILLAMLIFIVVILILALLLLFIFPNINYQRTRKRRKRNNYDFAPKGRNSRRKRHSGNHTLRR